MADAAVGVDDLEGSVGEEFGFPSWGVEPAVVPAAQHTRLEIDVGPPSLNQRMWASHQVVGRSQPAKRQRWSRMATAFHSGAGVVRMARP